MSQPTIAAVRNPATGVVETVTPEMALSWLKHSTGNRTLSRLMCQDYAAQMRAGHWVMNGEPIVFNDRGELVDGHHRLHSIVVAGCPVTMMVVRDVPSHEGVFQTIDSGKTRTLADRLSIQGESHAVILAGALRWLYRYEHRLTTLEAQRRMPTSELNQVLDRHADIREWIAPGQELYSAFGISKNMATFLRYATARRYREEADVFWDQCRMGVGLTAENAAYHLRNRFIRYRGPMRALDLVTLAYCIKCWNAHITKKKITVLYFDRMREEYPEIVGFPFPQ